MLSDLFRRGRLREELCREEITALEEAIVGTVELEPRERLADRRETRGKSYYVLEGAMLRHLDDGGEARQLVGIHLPGDLLDVHRYPMARLDHSLTSLMETTLAEIPADAFVDLVERYPRLGRTLWLSTLLDTAMHREWIFCIARLSAEERVAHLVSELIVRLRLVDRFKGRRLPLPLLQTDYAQACGITKVHANRCFRMLRERGLLIANRPGRLEILDEDGLREFGRFDGAYLRDATGPGAAPSGDRRAECSETTEASY